VVPPGSTRQWALHLAGRASPSAGDEFAAVTCDMRHAEGGHADLRLHPERGHRVSCCEVEASGVDQPLFELDGCEVLQSRVPTTVVVVRKPAEQIEPRVGLRGPPKLVRQLPLQPLEERLGQGID
jgi:hypothetical protein